MKAVCLPVLALTLWVAACSDQPTPAQPDTEPQMATVPVSVAAAPAISTLTITVSASDIPSDLVFNVSMTNGEATDTITIPAGSDRTITVRGFDAQAIETHRGSRVADMIEGLNAPLSIVLSALRAELPIVIVFGAVDIDVTLGRDTVSVGGSVQAVAIGVDEMGDTVALPVRWGTQHPAVATVDSAGRVTGLREGTTAIVATWQGAVGADSVFVVEPRPVALALTPDSARLGALGDSARFEALVLDQFGDTVLGTPLIWSSTDSSVAAVQDGWVRAVGNGTAVIAAALDSLTGGAQVVVQQEPATVAFEAPSVTLTFLGDTVRVLAEVRDSGGSALPGSAVAWTSANPSVAAVTTGGLVSAVAVGSTQLTARYGSVSGTLAVQVSQVPASVRVAPDTVIFYTIGDTVRFTASELDAGGTALPPVTGWVWNSDFDAVASIDPLSGLATALSYGTAGITAVRSGGAGTGEATLIVALTGSEVRLDQSEAIVRPGDSVVLKASVFDAAGNQLWDRNAYVGWSSSDASVATVQPGCAQARCTATVLANALGSATVIATSGSATAEFQLTVADQIPASVELVPAARTLTTIGETRQFYATVRDASGMEIADAPVTWSSSAPSVATIDSTGVVAAVANGSAVITASSGPVSATASVTVAVTAVNLSVTTVRLNQGNQSAAGDIPGVVGRAGLLRVVVQADQPNVYTPNARVSLYSAGQLLREELVAAPRSGVPMEPDLSVLTDTWNVTLTATEALADLDVVVELDPEGLIPESDEIDNVFASPIEMQALSPFRVVFFPIQATIHGTVGNISAANAPTMLGSTSKWIPTSSITYEFRDPFVTSEDLSTGDGWSNLLSALQAVRTSEGATDQYYHGIIGDFANPAWGGLAYVPSVPSSTFRSGLSYDRMPFAPATIAHELGHNLGRPHAPCGNPANPEAVFPYPDGSIGQPGYDIESGALISSSTKDYMSYCSPEWTSDWAFGQIVSWRAGDPLVSGSAVAGAGPAGRGLLIFGRITESGVSLSPAFTVDVPAGNVVPTGGRHEVTGTSGSGAAVFRVRFDGTPVADGAGEGEEHFSFIVPLSDEELASLERLELQGPNGSVVRAAQSGMPATEITETSMEQLPTGRLRISWDANQYPAGFLRDTRTQRLMGFVRGGDVEFEPRSTPVSALEVVLSDGLRSVPVRPQNE
jgi:uncharacterized protein YjdB